MIDCRTVDHLRNVGPVGMVCLFLLHLTSADSLSLPLKPYLARWALYSVLISCAASFCGAKRECRASRHKWPHLRS